MTASHDNTTPPGAERTLFEGVIALPGPTFDAAALEVLPGSSLTDPFVRLAAAFLAGQSPATARAYAVDLRSWAAWCAHLGVHPLAARRHHADAWVRDLTTTPRAATGRPASPATVSRRLSAVGRFYDYAIRDAELLSYSPVANLRRPRVSQDSTTPGLDADGLRRLLAAATTHSPRTAALTHLLVLTGLRISEALNARVTDLGHDRGHRTLTVTRKGGRPGRVPLPPSLSRTLDGYLAARTSGPLFLAANGVNPYPYRSAYDQLRRTARSAGLPGAERLSPHSLRHSFATEALSLGAPLQDVQDALGHADPRTTRRYDRARHNLDRSPTYLLAGSLVTSP